MTDRSQGPGEAVFIRRVLILLGIFGAAVLLFAIRHIAILVFGSIVVAVLLTAISNPIQRWTKLPRGVSLAIAIAFLVGIISAAVASFGNQAAIQAQQLVERLPAAWDEFRLTLGQWGIPLPDLGAGGPVVMPGPEAPREDMGQLSQDLLSRVGRLLMGVFEAIANTLLVLVGAIYLAAQPQLYRSGLLMLFPANKRELIGEAYDHSGRALRLWLLGTLISMSVVGLMTWAGLAALGVPSALALALLAFFLEFVPFIGPVASAIPAILVAFSAGVDMAIWTGLLFVGVQQIEGNIIQPLAQRYAVTLPPAILLFSIVAAGFLFGITGIIFAAPLTVVGYVLVKQLYVREALHTKTVLPDEVRRG